MGRILADYSNNVPAGPLRPGEAKLSDLARAVRSVPVAPEVIPKLQAKLRNLNTDSSDLAELIKLDAGLASSVLRTSNSAYYARSAEVTSLDEAVSLIGYQETMRLVTRCSFSTVMKNALEQYGVSGDQLWREAVLTAFAMEELCEVIGIDSSVGYIAGLLHAVGMVAINDYLNRRGIAPNPIEAVTNADFIPWEMKSIGFHHGQVGAAMMRGWQLPKQVALAVERQFDEEVPEDEPVVQYLLPIGITIAHRVARTVEGEECDNITFDHTRTTRAGLDGERLAEVTENVSKLWTRAKGALS